MVSGAGKVDVNGAVYRGKAVKMPKYRFNEATDEGQLLCLNSSAQYQRTRSV